MIRWRFILTRALIVVFAIVLLRFAMSPLMRFVTTDAIQTSTGATVELGRVHVGFFPPTVRYDKVNLRRPGRTDASVKELQADSIQLELDADALLHRRYVVRDGRIEGLRLDGKAFENALLDPQPEADRVIPTDWISQTIQSSATNSSDQAASANTDLQITRLADQIRRRWKSEYGVLSEQAAKLESTIAKLRDQPTGPENPLRDWQRVDATVARTKELQSELATVRTSIDEIPAKIQADLVSLQTAKQADQQSIDSSVNMTSNATGSSAATQLLSGSVNRQVDRLRSCLDVSRQLADWTGVQSQHVVKRGTNIDLLPFQRPATYLIQRCELDGDLSVGMALYHLSGIVENLTNEPRLSDEPYRARLRLDGRETVRLEYVRDDSSTVLRESLTVHWPELPAQTQTIGTPGTAAIELQGGRMELWAHVDSCGDVVQGRLVSRRIDTTIDVRGGADSMNTPLATHLRESLAGVDRVEADANFTGSWNDMAVSISTNLTQPLGTAIDRAAVAQSMTVRAKLAATLEDTYRKQLGELQNLLSIEQNQARQSLAKADATMQQFSDKVLTESRAADAYLGRLRTPTLK